MYGGTWKFLHNIRRPFGKQLRTQMALGRWLRLTFIPLREDLASRQLLDVSLAPLTGNVLKPCCSDVVGQLEEAGALATHASSSPEERQRWSCLHAQEAVLTAKATTT